MQPEPLPKLIYDEAKAQGVSRIELRFQGGNDEGYLHIHLAERAEKKKGETPSNELSRIIEEWAWSVYEYSGAGDGHDYGDDITYDLEDGTVTTSEWYTVVQDGLSEEHKLDICDTDFKTLGKPVP